MEWKDNIDGFGYYWMLQDGKSSPELVKLDPGKYYNENGSIEAWSCPGIKRYLFNINKKPKCKWMKIEMPIHET